MAHHDTEQNRLIKQMSRPKAWGDFFANISNAVCYLFVVIKAAMGAYGVGNIVQYVGVLTRLGEGLQEAMFIYTDNAVYCSHLQELFDFLDIPNKKYQGTLPIEKRAFCDGGDNDYEIEFQDVSFKYISVRSSHTSPGFSVSAASHRGRNESIGFPEGLLTVVLLRGSGYSVSNGSVTQ